MLIINILFSLLTISLTQQPGSQQCKGAVVNAGVRSKLNTYRIIFSFDKTCSKEPGIISCQIRGSCKQVGDDGSCVSYQIVSSNNHNICKKGFCPILKNQAPPLYTFFHCKNIATAGANSSTVQVLPVVPEKTQQDNQNIIGFVMVVASLGVFMFILGCIAVVKCKECCCEEERINIVVQPQTERGFTPIRQEVLGLKQWTKIPGKINYQEEFQSSCPICLNTGSNVSFECKHMYHKECIYEWLKRTMNCPLCKTTNIQKLNVYCRNCGGQSYQCQIYQLRSIFKEQDVCPTCVQNGLM